MRTAQAKLKPRRLLSLVVVTIAALTILSGCVSIPTQLIITSEDENGVRIEKPSACKDNDLTELAESSAEAALNPDGFRVMAWNTLKGKRSGWANDFRRLADEYDVVVLQEAQLDNQLRRLLAASDYHWHMSTAFLMNEHDIGVLTASKVTPQHACSLSTKEPVIRVPKRIMVSGYPLSG